LSNKQIRTKQDLVYQLLRTPLKELDKGAIAGVLDYLLELDEDTLSNPTLRARLSKVLGEHLGTIPLSHMEPVRDLLIRISLLDARTNFYSFVKLIAETVIPNQFKDGRHIQLICENLQTLYESYDNPDVRTERLQVFLPPRSMKSVLCSILFPAWILGRNPKYRIILVGNSVQTATDVFGRPLKNFIASHEYQEVFPGTLIDPDANSAQRFNTTEGGGYFVAGAGTGIAGRGGDFIICDDMLSEQNAFSKTERTKINNNYIPGIRSRAQPGAAELIVNTRWHLEDPSGFLLKVDVKSKRPWKVISVPAILDKAAVELLRKKTDPPDFYKEGGSYWPEYKPLEDLLELKDNYMKTEPWKWWALYMQNPVPEEGGVIKHSDWRIWDSEDAPQVSQILVSMDTAYGDTERADYSAFTVWGVFHKREETLNGIQLVPNMILLYAEKGKWDFHTLCAKCEWIRSDSPWKPDFFVIEKKASGIVLHQELHRRGFPLIEYDPRGKKLERLQAASMLIKAGRVWLPEGKEWADEVKDEVCSFPSTPHDDLTDTVSMAVIWMRDNGVIHYEAYDYETEDEDGGYSSRGQRGGFTYWDAASRGSRH
jgi:predicted phage terminase large subunit-like protein